MILTLTLPISLTTSIDHDEGVRSRRGSTTVRTTPPNPDHPAALYLWTAAGFLLFAAALAYLLGGMS